MAKKFLTPIGLPSGTSNPATAQAGELFYRSDVNAIYIYTGTAWVPQADSDTVVGILVEFGIVGGDSGTPATAAFTATVEGGGPSSDPSLNYDGGIA